MKDTFKEIPQKFRIHPNTKIGKDPHIEDYVVLGVPSKNTTRALTIGDYSCIRSHTIIYSGNSIGDNFQTGHSVFVQENNRIGNKVSLGTKSVILSNCQIADDVRIHTQVFIPEYTVIEKNAWIGPNVVLTNTKHPTCEYAKECLKADFVTVRERAIIGANSTILPGIEIGEQAFVGAGSVVVENVPKNSVVVGNPAKFIKKTSSLECSKNFTDKPYSNL